jgi:hypothetical protein
MGIKVFWLDENNIEIDHVVDIGWSLNQVSDIVRLNSLNEYIYLWDLDWYDDALFNQEQLPDLLDELIRVKAITSGPIQSHLDKVIELVRRSIGKNGTYLCFRGD